MIQTVSQHLRIHLLESLGMIAPGVRLPGLDVLRTTEWCPEFVMLMQNRLIMGAFRYGRFDSPEKWRYDFIGGLKKKIAQYEATGNMEHLVDMSNYPLLEFVRPSHPNAHWKATDDHTHCPPQPQKVTR